MGSHHPFQISQSIEVKVRKDTRFFRTTVKALAPAIKARLGISGSSQLPEPDSILVLLSYNGRASRPQEGGVRSER